MGLAGQQDEPVYRVKHLAVSVFGRMCDLVAVFAGGLLSVFYFVLAVAGINRIVAHQRAFFMFSM